jgi:hypothetical protein
MLKKKLLRTKSMHAMLNVPSWQPSEVMFKKSIDIRVSYSMFN